MSIKANQLGQDKAAFGLCIPLRSILHKSNAALVYRLFATVMPQGSYIVKVTKYFESIRLRPDRVIIKDEWIQLVIEFPEREYVQADGRIRRWARIDDMEGKYLRVVLLQDRETVHNAFFDRGYKP
jgi:hypothetical protein